MKKAGSTAYHVDVNVLTADDVDVFIEVAVEFGGRQINILEHLFDLRGPFLHE